MPGIIFQLLTLSSYSKELKEGKELKKQNEEQRTETKEEIKQPEEKDKINTKVPLVHLV